MSAIISGLIGGAISVALTTYIAKRVGRSEASGVLRFGMFMWAVGGGCLAFAVLPVVMTLLGNHREFWAKILLFLGFGLASVYCFGEVMFVRGRYDSEGIWFSTPWTGQKQEKWTDLQSVELNAWFGWYTLTFKSGSRIRLSQSLGGHLDALEMAESRGVGVEGET